MMNMKVTLNVTQRGGDFEHIQIRGTKPGGKQEHFFDLDHNIMNSEKVTEGRTVVFETSPRHKDVIRKIVSVTDLATGRDIPLESGQNGWGFNSDAAVRFIDALTEEAAGKGDREPELDEIVGAPPEKRTVLKAMGRPASMPGRSATRPDHRGKDPRSRASRITGNSHR